MVKEANGDGDRDVGREVVVMDEVMLGELGGWVGRVDTDMLATSCACQLSGDTAAWCALRHQPPHAYSTENNTSNYHCLKSASADETSSSNVHFWLITFTWFEFMNKCKVLITKLSSNNHF